jgi:hypothetical protein
MGHRLANLDTVVARFRDRDADEADHCPDHVEAIGAQAVQDDAPRERSRDEDAPA